MRKLLAYIRPYAGKMSVVFIIKFIGTIMDLFLPWILAFIIDSVIPRKDVTLILWYGSAMVVCSFVAWTCNVIPNRKASWIATRITRSLRHDLFSRVLALSAAQADVYGSPSLISRVSSDTYNVHEMVAKMQRLGVRAPILLIGGMAITLSLEPVLTLILIALMPLIGIVVYAISRRGIPLYTVVQKKVDALVRAVRSDITGIRVIKALSKMEYEKERFSVVNKDVTDAERHAAHVMAVTNPLMNLFLNLGLTLVVLFGAWRVNDGLTEPGRIIAFLSYFTIILTAMLSITRMFVILSKGIASARRIEEIMDMEGERKQEKSRTMNTDGGITKGMDDAQMDNGEVYSEKTLVEGSAEKAHVVFNDVSFFYPRTTAGVRNVSFALKKGQTLGIIGATGSGKSTVVKLLLRLYDVNSGSVRINGVDVRDIPDDVLYEQFGVVFQNDFILADTIRENISFGRDLDDQAILCAAEIAQATPIIAGHPEGLDYRLAIMGANISGGQKQRILIARALAAQPAILVMDDAMSALDYRTDALVRGGIARSLAETTTIIVAQRISSIMHADHILVMEDGQVIGSGTHGHLVATCEVYRDISSSQIGGQDEKRA
ncbi:ABC transporter ATP-binding protein [Parasphaerochaeta coccoides]|uniref:Xenobiotic-transporting ATPase n=1 Tax=Parasphaerochaeta coccoides (strain ATCC BAA-1237 / DSM 17374 / SPN1) TaxID=760011 RepID=F4GM06_PARC1|nr:ABC transporter ATP-binding protein [Parasphaerochaeta coccoides]AEC02481.1 Xenobiotic-transporting ATPase [Parasphaerochaeta coccoides DSM 17374]